MSGYDMSKYDQALGEAQRDQEKQRFRHQLAAQAAGSAYSSWTENQNLRLAKLLQKKGTIGGEDIPMYEQKGNWFSDLFTPAKGRVGVTPEYQKALKTKAYGESFDPEIGGFTPTEDQESAGLLEAFGKDKTGYGALETPGIGQGDKAGLFSKFSTSDLAKDVKSYLSTPRGPQGITKYSFGPGGVQNVTSGAAGTLGGATPAVQNVVSKGSEALGAVGDFAGDAGGVLSAGKSAYNLGQTLTDTKSLDISKKGGAQNIAGGVSDVAHLVTAATGGASAPITEPIAWLARGLSMT